MSLLTAVLVMTRAINLQPGSAGRSWVDDYVPITLVAARTSIHRGATQTAQGAPCPSRPPAARSSQAEELGSGLDRLQEPIMGASSLTTAELRLLPLLPTHLSFREIGERLYISQHTAKKHATSLYQKLGVSSRSQAVQRARQLGLLGKE